MSDLFSLSGRLPVIEGRELAAVLVMFGVTAGNGLGDSMRPSLLISELLEPAQEQAEVQLAARQSHAQELLGGDFAHFRGVAGADSVADVNRFVLDRTERSLMNAEMPASPEAVRRTASAIIHESNRFGFDPIFVLAVIENESRFRTDAVGTHGEVGLMQIRPGTARWISEKLKLGAFAGRDSLLDPSVNVRIGVAYLSFLRKRFPSDKDLYMAAYNMGTANVLKSLRESVHPDEYARRTMTHYRKLYGEWHRHRPGRMASRRVKRSGRLAI